MRNVSQIVEVQEVEVVVPILLLIYFYPKTFSPCLCTTTYNICARHFRYLVRPRPWMANPLWSTLTFRFRGWRQIHETDKGSKPHLACLIVQGVPADGVIDTGADIVIMGKELFARVAATERLHKKSLGSQTECHGLMTERDSSGWVHGHGPNLCW